MAIGLHSRYTNWETYADICVVLVFFSCALVLTRDAARIRSLLSAWIVSAALVCLYYFAQNLGLDPIVRFNEDPGAFGSTLGNRNFMAYFLVCALPYAFYLAAGSKSSSRTLWFFAGGLIAVTLATCHSRSSLVILALNVPLYVTHMLRGRFPRIRVGILALCVLGAILCFAFLVKTQWSAGELESLTHGRFEIWKDTLRLIAERPWFGHGPGSFPRVYPAFRSHAFGFEFGFYSPIYNSHNVGLEILSEMGLAGLLLFAILIASGAGLFSFVSSVAEENRHLAFFSALSLLDCGIFSLTGEVCHVLFCTLILAFSGLALAACERFYSVFSASGLIKNATDMIGSGPNPVLAKPYLDKALARQPRNPFALYQLAYIAMWQQQYRQALVFYDSVLAVEPYFENIHYNMALGYYSLGEFPEAMDALAVTYRLYPTFGDGVYLLSESFLAMDDLRNAELWRSRLAATGFDGQRSEALHQSILLRARAKGTAPAAP